MTRYCQRLKRWFGTCARVSVFCAFVALTACGHSGHGGSSFANPVPAEPRRISLDGEWQFVVGNADGDKPLAASPDRAWRSITVPSNWFLEGYDFAGVAHYRLDFKAPDGGEDVYRLRFEAVDYFADVWLNGTKLGRHTGYFQPFEFDVSAVIRPGLTNTLLVRVDSPLETSDESWSLHKRLIKGIFGHHDTRPGGAWSDRGQEKNTGGIIGGVSLLLSKTIAIGKVRVEPRIFGNGMTQAHLTVPIQNSVDEARTIRLSARLEPRNFNGEALVFVREVSLKPGANTVSWLLSEHQGRIWWPRELGHPSLYDLHLAAEIKPVQGGAAAELLDQADLHFGYRTITYDENSGHWFINGKRYFLRGSNYISSQWLTEMDLNAYRRDIALMELANINVVRVHAHIEAAAFYQAADEAGMLVWQDFPLQWGYDDGRAFLEDAVRQTGDMIDMLVNHPSVIVYSMHNEPPWDADWMKYKYPDYDPEQNKALTEAVYAQALSLEKKRYIQKFSSTQEHPWLGWYSGSWLEYAKPTDRVLITEYGAQALPNRDSLRRIFAEPDMWPQNDAQWDLWAYHNFQKHEAFEIAGVQSGKNTGELIKNTQDYQSKLIKLAAESYRRQKYAPVGGIFQFMFVENWPSFNWGIVDYWRVPKPGFTALAQAYQPVLPSIEWEKQEYDVGETVTARLWVVNDLLKNFESLSLTATLVSSEGVVNEWRYSVNVPADSVQKLMEVTAGRLEAGLYELVVRLRQPDGRHVGLNSFNFRVRDAAS